MRPPRRCRECPSPTALTVARLGAGRCGGRRLVLCAMLALGLSLAGPGSADAQWVVGARGGLSAFTVGGKAPEDANYGRQLRLVASGLLGYRIGSSVVIRIEPGLVQRGAGVAFDVDGIEDPVDSLSLSLDYLSVPVVAQVFTPGGRGFVTTGLDVGFLSSASLAAVRGDAEEDVKDRLESTDVAWLFGVGGLVYRGSPEISLELRYSQSLLKVFDGGGSGNSATLPGGLRSSGFQLAAGVAWRLGGGR